MNRYHFIVSLLITAVITIMSLPLLACYTPIHPYADVNADPNDPDPNSAPIATDTGQTTGGDPIDLQSGTPVLTVHDIPYLPRYYYSYQAKNRPFNVLEKRYDFDASGSYSIIQPPISLGLSWDFPPEAYDIKYSSSGQSASCKFRKSGYFSGGTYVSYTDCPPTADCMPAYASDSVNVPRQSSHSRLGNGWFLGHLMQMVPFSYGSTMQLTAYCSIKEGGGALMFYPAGGDTYTSDMVPDILTKNQDNTFTLEQKNGTKYQYNVKGNLVEIEDPIGVTLVTFTYELPSGADEDNPNNYRIDEMRQWPWGPAGKEVTYEFTYNAAGFIEEITNDHGKTWTFGYGSYDTLTSVTKPGTDEYPDGITTYYEYTWYGYRLSIIKDHNGDTWQENIFNANGKVAYQTYGGKTFTFNYDEDNNKTTQIDPNGFITDYYFDDQGRTLKEVVYTDDLRPGDPNSFTTEYEYDSLGRQTRAIYPEDNAVHYTYDTKNNITQIDVESSDPGDPNLVTEFQYHATFNTITKITDPNDNEIDFTYDPTSGKLTKITYPPVVTDQGTQVPEIEYTYDAYNRVETVTSPDNIVIKYEYYNTTTADPNYGHLKKTIVDYGTGEALNIPTEYQWDLAGNCISITDPNNDTITMDYNVAGLLTEVKLPSPYGYNTQFTYTYDYKLDKVKRQFNGGYQETDYGYNILAKLTSITNALNQTTTIGYNDNYDPNSITDANTHQTVKALDERGLLWKVTDAEDGVTQFNYTPNGQLEMLIDAEDNETQYSYDGYGRLETITYPNNTTESFEYNNLSKITKYTNRRDQEIRFEYDALGRLVFNKIKPDDPNIYFTYDIAGRLKHIDRGDEDIEVGYDRVGRLSEYTSADGKTVGYEYDNLSRRTKLVYPDNSYITYHYDRVGRLVEIRDQSASAIATFTYDELSRRTSLTLANGSVTTYDYEDLDDQADDNLGNRLEGITVTMNDGLNTVLTFAYTYDNVGNCLTRTINGSSQYTYTYDDTYRLKTTDDPLLDDETYTYDNVGNWLIQLCNGSHSFTANNMNQYSLIDGTRQPEYDLSGNMTDDGNGRTTFFDSENRLYFGTKSPDTWFEYDYDPFGRRVMKFVEVGNMDTETRYVYDGPHCIAETDLSGTIQRKFIYGPGIDEPLMMIVVDDYYQTETKYYYHRDALENVMALSDANGNIVEGYTYSAFGIATVNRSAGTDGDWLTPDGTTSDKSAKGNPYMFTGRRYDPESGLYYYRARYYDATLGRFISADPISYLGGMNLYAYVNNNPLNWMDPYGLFSWKKFFKGVAQVVGGVVETAVGIGIAVAGSVPGAIGGAVLMTHGGASVGFGVANIVDAFQNDDPLPASSYYEPFFQAAGMDPGAAAFYSKMGDMGTCLIAPATAGLDGFIATGEAVLIGLNALELAVDFDLGAYDIKECPEDTSGDPNNNISPMNYWVPFPGSVDPDYEDIPANWW